MKLKACRVSFYFNIFSTTLSTKKFIILLACSEPLLKLTCHILKDIYIGIAMAVKKLKTMSALMYFI